MTLSRLLPLCALLVTLCAAAPAVAGIPVALNANLSDESGQVTLGELFDNAGPARDVVVAARIGPTVVLDAASVQAFARRYGLDWANETGLRRIIVRGEKPGAAGHAVEVLTYAHSLITGQIVQPSDLLWSKAAGSPVDAPAGVDAVVGLAARRPLREGDAVASRDLTAPMVIKAGETVMITYADDGVSLTMQAKAMANAAAGDTFNVQNPNSKKVIEAVATGPGEAVVGPEALRLKVERGAQFAVR
jgi:flagellar basal body P-ring formation protein FlgA